MGLSMGEKIKIMMGRRDFTLTQLAETLGTTRHNLTNMLSRDNFSEKDLLAIDESLGCTYEAKLIMKDTGEEV